MCTKTEEKRVDFVTNVLQNENMSFCSRSALLLLFALSTLLKADTIVIMGSDTIGAKAALHLAEAYKDKVKEANPDLGFEISAEGSSTGIVSITEGHADIGMASRPPSPQETARANARGVKLKTITVARDGIAIIAHNTNPLESISLAEVEAIFTGDIENWAALSSQSGEISAYTRNTASGTYDIFRELAMSSRDYGKNCQMVAGNEQIASEVARNPNAIGYVGLAYANSAGVKVLPVDGMLPQADSYPLSRTLFYLVDDNIRLSPIANDFIGFTLSPQGQHIIQEAHFLPLY